MILLLTNISKVRLAWMRLYLELLKIGDDVGRGWGGSLFSGVVKWMFILGISTVNICRLEPHRA